MAEGQKSNKKNRSKMDWQNSSPSLEHGILKLQNSQKFTDVTFIVGEGKEKIHAHKLILVARSSVFETMFERWETQQNSEIVVPDISISSFKLFLEYVYSGKVSIETLEDAEDVLYIAHKYNTLHLEEYCCEAFKTGINVGNAVRLLNIASTLNKPTLKADTMDFIHKNAKAFFNDDGFIQTKSDVLISLLKSDKLYIDELTVFCATMRWVKNQCKVQNLPHTLSNKKEILKNFNLINLIRFPLMHQKEFTVEVVRKHKDLLEGNEVIALYAEFTTGIPDAKRKCLSHPFSRKKRVTALIAEVSYEEIGRFNVGGDVDKTCRSQQNGQGENHAGQLKTCEATFLFSPDRDVYIAAIELQPLDSFLGASVLEDGVPQEKLELIILSDGKQIGFAQINAEIDQHLPKEIHFREVVKASKSKTYHLKIVATLVSNFDRYYRFGRPRKVSGKTAVDLGKKENVTFTFSSVGGKCWTNNPHKTSCICNELAKTIHFII